MPSLTALIALDSAFLASLFYSGYVGSHLPPILFFILANLFKESRLSNSGTTWLVSPRWLLVGTFIYALAQFIVILIFTFAAGLSDVFLQWMEPHRQALDACGIYVPEVTGWYEFCLSLITDLILLIVCALNLYLVHGRAKFHTLVSSVPLMGAGDEDDMMSFPSSSSASRPNLGTVVNLSRLVSSKDNNNTNNDEKNNSIATTNNTSFPRETSDSTSAFPSSSSAGGGGGASTANLSRRERKRLLKQQKEKEEQEKEERLATLDVERNPPRSGLFLLLCWAALCALAAVAAPSYLAFPLFFIYILVVGVAVLSPSLNSRGSGSGAGDSMMLTLACHSSLYYSCCLAALVMGAQNSLSKSTSNQEVGLVSWRELVVHSKDDSAARNILNSLFLFLTCVVSRALIYTSLTSEELMIVKNKFGDHQEHVNHHNSDNDENNNNKSNENDNDHGKKKKHHHHHHHKKETTDDSSQQTTSWVITSLESHDMNAFTVWLVDFLLTNGPFWIFPIFVVTCVSSPTTLSVILLIVLFVASLNFKFFTTFAPSFYILCACISISVYFVNIITGEVPVAVKIIIANRDRDGAALPLIFQGAASGFAAISYVFFRFAEFIARDNDRKNNMKSAAALSKLKNIYWLGEGEADVLKFEADIERKLDSVMKSLKDNSVQIRNCGDSSSSTAESLLAKQNAAVFQAAKEAVPMLTEVEFEEELKPLLLIASGIEPEEMDRATSSSPIDDNNINNNSDNVISIVSQIKETSIPMLSVTNDDDHNNKPSATPAAASSENNNNNNNNDDDEPQPLLSRTKSSSMSKNNSNFLSDVKARSRALSQVQQRKKGSSFVDPQPILPFRSSSSSNNNNNNNNNSLITANKSSGSTSNIDGSETHYQKFEDESDDKKKTTTKKSEDEEELMTTRTFSLTARMNNNPDSSDENTQKKIEDSNNDGMLYRKSAIRQFLLATTLESAKRKLLVEVFLSLLIYVLRFGTYALCILMVFAVSTCEPDFDTFHLPLLIFTVACLSLPNVAIKLWPLLVIYMMILSTWRFILASLNTGPVLMNWQNETDVRVISLLGIQSNSQYVLYLYIATALLCVAEWRLQKNRHLVNLEQWLSHRYDRRLISDPRVVRFYRLVGLGCLILVLGYRAVFERSIVFLLIMILFFILSGLFTFTNMRLTVLWNVGVVLSSIMLLLEASFQIVIAASPDYAWDADCDPGTICAKDLGLQRHENYFSLTGSLLPSFLSVAFFAAMSGWSKTDNGEKEKNVKKRFEADCSNNNNNKATENRDDAKLTNNNNNNSFASGGDGEETEFTSLGFERIFTFLLGIINICEQLLIANLRFVVWGTLVFAAVFNPGATSFIYALIFIFDIRGFSTSVISGVHMLLIYFLRFSLVSGSFTDYTRDVFHFIGWMPADGKEDETWRLLLGPMLCFVSSLCYENMERLTAETKKKLALEKRRESQSVTNRDSSLGQSLLNNNNKADDTKKEDDTASEEALPPSASTASKVKFDIHNSSVIAEVTHYSSGDDDDDDSDNNTNSNDDSQQEEQSETRPRKGTLSRIEQTQREKEDKLLEKMKKQQTAATESGNDALAKQISASYFSMVLKRRKEDADAEKKKRFESMRKVPESVSSIILMIRDFVRSCSYELLLLTHLIGSAVCIEHVSGLLHVIQVTVISFAGRVAVTSKPSITFCFIVFESFLFISQASIAMEPYMRKLVFRHEEDPGDWLKYLGLGEAQILSIWTAFSLIILRVMQQLHETSIREFDKNRQCSGGFATLQEMMHARNDIQKELDQTVAESDAHEELLQEFLSGADKVPQSSTTNRRIIAFTTYVLPTAVLSFFEGLGALSMINAFIIFSGLVMLSNQRRIHWRNHILWNRWIWFCDLIPWMASICNLPPVAAYLVEHHIFQVIGLANKDGPMQLSALRVALFWSAHLQRRVFETFDFAEHLKEIHSSKVTDVVRHQEMAERIRKWELGELAQAKKENRDRQRRLEEIRKARFESSSMTASALQQTSTVPMLDAEEKAIDDKNEETAVSIIGVKNNKSDDEKKQSSSQRRRKSAAGETGDDNKEDPEEQENKTRKNMFMNDDDESSGSDDDEEEEEEEEELDEFGFVKTKDGDDNNEDDWIVADDEDTLPTFDPEATLREKIEAVVDAVAASLSKRSYEDFAKVKEKHPDSPFRRLLTSLFLLAETHTADITLMIQLINCANSGTIFDSVLPAVGLAFAFVRTPWPPSWYWRLCIVFSMISVVTKTCLSLLASEIQFTPSAKHWLQVVIFKVPEEVSVGEATSGTLFLDLGLDFTILFFVLVHRYLSRRLGLSDESFSSSTQASTALSKTFMQNLVTRFGVGIDLYSISVTIDGLCFIIVLFGYYSLFPDDSASSVLDSFKSNLLPGPLVVALLSLLILVCIDRVMYLMQAVKAKLVVHVLTVITVQGVYIWWKNVLLVNAAPGVILFLLKLAGSYLSATQLRRGYPLVRQHDPFSTRPYPPFSILYPVYRAIPFLFELRTLLDWTFTRTSLPCHYWLKLEDIAHEVYNRNIDRYDHTKTNPSPGFATKFIWKFGLGFLVFIGLFFVMFFPLMYYSTFNPSLQDNEILEAEVQCTFGPITTWFRGRIAQKSDDPPLQSWLSLVRPSFIQAMRSSGSTTQLFNIAQCSTFNWQISPPALNTLRERLVETAYPANFSRGLFDPLQFRNTINIQRKGSVTPEGKTAEFIRQMDMTPETAKALIILTDSFSQSNLSKRVNHTTNSPNTNSNNNNPTSSSSASVLQAKVRIEDFWLPIISSDPNTASLFKSIKVPCDVDFYEAIDPRTGAVVQYSCVSCAPLFSRGNTPNKTYPEYAECLTDPRHSKCSKYNFDKNSSRLVAPTDGGQSLYFYVVNERVPTESGFLPNVGIVALYSTFVIAIWRIIRGLFSGMAFKVVLEDMADPDKVKELIDLIYLSRESKRADALLLEEALYFELLDMVRGPEGLLKVTGLRSVLQQQHGKNTSSSNNNTNSNVIEGKETSSGGEYTAPLIEQGGAHLKEQ